jgi:hypothetical protein
MTLDQIIGACQPSYIELNPLFVAKPDAPGAVGA